MLVVVIYDISTSYGNGTERLRKVAKICSKWGMRVQKSVFECEITEEEFQMLQRELKAVIKNTMDSIRFYHLGNHYKNKISSIGRKDMSWNDYLFVV